MEKIKRHIKNYLKDVNDNGFSLIELVVAVGILAILSVVGLVAYSKITDNARTATVQSAAAEVYTGIVAYESNGGKAADAVEEWKNSSNGSINVVVDGAGDTLCVKTTMKEHTNINASKGPGCGGSTTPGNGGNEGGNVEEAVKYRVNLDIQVWNITNNDGSLDSAQIRFPLTGDVFTIPKNDDGHFIATETFDIPGSSGITEEQLTNYVLDYDTSTQLYEQALSNYDGDRYDNPGDVWCNRKSALDTVEGSTEIKVFNCSINSL